MTSKEVVQKVYEAFVAGDMDAFRALYHKDVVVKTNGMHKFSGTYNGFDAWLNNMVMHIPTHFDNFKVKPKLMVAEGDYVFALILSDILFEIHEGVKGLHFTLTGDLVGSNFGYLPRF